MSKILIDEVTAKQVLEYVESVPDDRYAVEHIDRDTLVTDLREALASEAKKPDFWEGYVPEPDKRQQALDRMAENARELGLDYEPAQQEPVAVPTTPYEHRKFVLVGRKWYERFAAFHDDCQIGERLTREEQTVRQQGYENGWNDAQRYLREPQASPPTQPQQEPVVIHQFRSPHCSDWYDGVPDHHDGYGPYEVRTLYTSPPAQPVQDNPLDCGVHLGSGKDHEIKHHISYGPEPIDTLIAAWQALEETSDRVPDEGNVEGRIHMSVIRSAWKQMDSLVRDLWDKRGRP